MYYSFRRSPCFPWEPCLICLSCTYGLFVFIAGWMAAAGFLYSLDLMLTATGMRWTLPETPMLPMMARRMGMIDADEEHRERRRIDRLVTPRRRHRTSSRSRRSRSSDVEDAAQGASPSFHVYEDVHYATPRRRRHASNDHVRQQLSFAPEPSDSPTADRPAADRRTANRIFRLIRRCLRLAPRTASASLASASARSSIAVEMTERVPLQPSQPGPSDSGYLADCSAQADRSHDEPRAARKCRRVRRAAANLPRASDGK